MGISHIMQPCTVLYCRLLVITCNTLLLLKFYKSSLTFTLFQCKQLAQKLTQPKYPFQTLKVSEFTYLPVWAGFCCACHQCQLPIETAGSVQFQVFCSSVNSALHSGYCSHRPTRATPLPESLQRFRLPVPKCSVLQTEPSREEPLHDRRWASSNRLGNKGKYCRLTLSSPCQQEVNQHLVFTVRPNFLYIFSFSC